MLRTHDNWERLVGAVIKKQQLWELCHAHSRSPSVLSEASLFSDLSSSSFQEINTSSAYPVRKLVFVSDFVPAFDVDDANLNSPKLLGTGTFANTYLGDVSGGIKIVVKRINKSVSVSEEEFKRSMDFVGSIRHENVVALRAYYNSKDVKLMMYDFYAQGSVYQLLHGQTSETPPQVEWKTRLRIAIGAARGLAFIHAQNGGKLVHGNVKSTNIFLNQENYGSISDLGMINLIASKFRRDEHCHAPEVKHNTRNVSQESDVYSFGILTFELLTRKPSVGSPDAADLVKLMKSVRRTNMTSKVFDPYLIEDPTIREHMVRVLQIGISCVVKSMKKRPKMSEVAKMLEDLYVTNAPKGRGFGLVNLNLKSELENMFEDLDILFEDSWHHIHRFPFPDNKVFGTSYTERRNGTTVRVKRMKGVNVTAIEFRRHMDIIGRLNHENCAILKSYDYFVDKALLVYDHCYTDDNLSVLLHGTSVGDMPHFDELDVDMPRSLPFLAWDARLTIALTLAKGIAHIHRLMLVHGNIRSSIIFVDRHNNAIINDTALWKVTKPIKNYILRHQGHFAPEVNDTRSVSQASDVYSFGVVLLEILTRRRPEQRLVSLVRRVISTMPDIELLRHYAKMKVLQLAMDCVEDAPEQRPKMYAVVKRLKQIQRPSLPSDSEHARSRLEDALEDQLSNNLPIN